MNVKNTCLVKNVLPLKIYTKVDVPKFGLYSHNILKCECYSGNSIIVFCKLQVITLDSLFSKYLNLDKDINMHQIKTMSDLESKGYIVFFMSNAFRSRLQKYLINITWTPLLHQTKRLVACY